MNFEDPASHRQCSYDFHPNGDNQGISTKEGLDQCLVALASRREARQHLARVQTCEGHERRQSRSLENRMPELINEHDLPS